MTILNKKKVNKRDDYDNQNKKTNNSNNNDKTNTSIIPPITPNNKVIKDHTR